MGISKEEIEKLRIVPMVFILGRARSGTSLLQNLLNANPGVIGGPESKFMVIFYPYFAHIKKWREKDVLAFVEKLYMERLFTTLWNLDKKQLTETLLCAGEDANYALLCKIVYYQLSKGKQDLVYISDKNPEYILHLNTILKIFPDAKFIHIVREPRDNIYSQIISFKSKNIIFRANQWVGFNSIVEKMKKKGPQHYITVLYENLVTDPEKNMKLICNFLHISFTDALTQNEVPEWLKGHMERKGIKDTEKMVHRNLLKPLNTSNVGKWRNKMDPRDQYLTEIITGDFARKVYGYDIGNNQNNKPVLYFSFELLKGKILYHVWQKFIQLKAKSFRFNRLYSKLKRKVKKNVPIWEYY